jgi:uncharacterized protein with PIN domain
MEGRILLVCSKDLARRGIAPPMAGYHLVASGDRVRQLVEVGMRWPIFSQADPFSRCADCNEPLLHVESAEARKVVPAFVAATHLAFQSCPVCTRIFWAGTHTREMLRLFQTAAEQSSQPLPARIMKSSAGSEASNPALPNG